MYRTHTCAKKACIYMHVECQNKIYIITTLSPKQGQALEVTDNHRSFLRRWMTCNAPCPKLVQQLSLSALPAAAPAAITSWHLPAKTMLQIHDFHLFCNRQTTDSHRHFSWTTGSPCAQTPDWNPQPRAPVPGATAGLCHGFVGDPRQLVQSLRPAAARLQAQHLPHQTRLFCC